MQKQFLKFRKVFTNIACSPLFLISNNSELAAKYLPTEVPKSFTTLEINSTKHDLVQGFHTKKDENRFRYIKKARPCKH